MNQSRWNAGSGYGCGEVILTVTISYGNLLHITGVKHEVGKIKQKHETLELKIKKW